MDDCNLPPTSSSQQTPKVATGIAVGVPVQPPPSSLDNPHVDKIINSGTTAANCQPKHTRVQLEQSLNGSISFSSDDNDGNSSTLSADSSVSASSRASQQQRKMELKALKKAQKEEAKLRKSQEKQKAKEEKLRLQQQKEKQEQMNPKKLGYIEMAKMGYQELVNAIIRPPRADYKVCLHLFFLSYFMTPYIGLV